MITADLDGSKGAFGRSTLGNTVASADALENSFADDLKSTPHSPTIG